MSELSAQVLTVAHHPQTGEERVFSTPEAVPNDWIEGPAEGAESDAESIGRAARTGLALVSLYVAYRVVFG